MLMHNPPHPGGLLGSVTVLYASGALKGVFLIRRMKSTSAIGYIGSAFVMPARRAPDVSCRPRWSTPKTLPDVSENTGPPLFP